MIQWAYSVGGHSLVQGPRPFLELASTPCCPAPSWLSRCSRRAAARMRRGSRFVAGIPPPCRAAPWRQGDSAQEVAGRVQRELLTEVGDYMPEPMVMSRWKAPSCGRHSPVPELCQHLLWRRGRLKLETSFPFRLIWFNPMNLLTFSEMKRILPSSARRKRKPSMDSRCSSFSRGRSLAWWGHGCLRSSSGPPRACARSERCARRRGGRR